MAPTKAPDSSRRSDRSRRAIHDAALALVGEVGYRRTTIEGIAARAGVGKQTIYRWWPSKAAVLMEAFLDLAGRAAEEAGPESGDTAQGIPDTGDLAADLKLVLRATVDELNDPALDVPTRALTAEGVVDACTGRRIRIETARTAARAVRHAAAGRPGGRTPARRRRPPDRPGTAHRPADAPLAAADPAAHPRVRRRDRRLRPRRAHPATLNRGPGRGLGPHRQWAEASDMG